MIQASLFMVLGLLVGFLGSMLFRKKSNDENDIELFQEISKLNERKMQLEDAKEQLEARCLDLRTEMDRRGNSFQKSMEHQLKVKSEIKEIMETKRFNRYITKGEFDTIINLLN